MELSHAIKLLLGGNTVLFAGSGLSISAKNLRNDHFVSGGTLAEKLYSECDEKYFVDLEDAVDVYLDKFGESRLIRFLQNEFTVSHLSPELRLLGKVEWKRIYTTNYDNVIEEVYRESGKRIIPVTLADKPVDYDKENVCVHLNGNIENLTHSTLNTEFKLTSASYLSDDFNKSEWVNLFRLDLKTADAVFFIGFSMKYDLDIKRVIYSNESKDKTFFIVSENESAASIRQLKKFGTPLPIGFKKFLELVEIERSNYHPIKRLEHYFSFKKVVPDFRETLPIIQDANVLDLFVKGVQFDNLTRASIQLPDKYPYYVTRTEFEGIRQMIQNGEKNIVLHSNMGNGKTLFLNGLKHFLSLNGFSVFEYEKYLAPAYRELEDICQKSTDKTVLLIDGYNNDWNLLDVIRLHRKNLTLITCERTLTYDVTSSRLETVIGEFISLDINRLDAQEIDTIVGLFDTYGLWEALSKLPKHQKSNNLSIECGGEFRNILVKILESPHILQLFEQTISSIKEKKGYYEGLVFILLSNVYGFTLDMDNLAYILGYDVVNNSSFEKNLQIGEFVDFKSDKIVVKSPILSQVILSKITDPYLIVDTLLKIFTKLDSQIQHKPYRQIMKALVSHSAIQRVLNKSDRSYTQNIIRFFEGIKNTRFCSQNPHFWLQYAIQKLSERDYDTAGRYFKTAYSFASKTDNETYQIDNHYARYVLENAVQYANSENCMTEFKIAHDILNNPVQERRVMYYPYRVAQNYLPFFQKFYPQMNTSLQREFIQCCEQILEKIERFTSNTPNYAEHRDVLKAKSNLNYILSSYKK